jgi:branched-chain amino acid transport system substrate-binding protein
LRLLVFLSGLLLTIATTRAEILIGVAGPFSGQFGILGNQLRVGVDAAVKSINASGGINGEPLAVLAIDDGCETRRAIDAAKEFVAKDARAVIGHYCSGTSLAASLVYKDAGIVMISPSATAPQLTDARHWNVLRLASRDDALAELITARINTLPELQNPVFIGDGQPASEVLFAAVKAKRPDMVALTFKAGAANISRLRQDLAARQPQSVMLGLPGAEAVRVTTLLTDLGFTGRVFGGESLLSEDFTNRTGVLDFEVLVTIPSDPAQNQLAAPVVAELTLSGQEVDGAALPAYAATQVFAAAAKATSVNDGKAMAQWLRNGQKVDTILGSLSFDGKGDLQNPAISWYTWNGAANRFLPQ